VFKYIEKLAFEQKKKVMIIDISEYEWIWKCDCTSS